MIWAACRFGLIGASSSLSLIALLSMVGITGAQGLFPGSAAPQNVLFVQLFLAVMSVPVLFAAILIEERGAVEMRLRESQEKLGENYRRARELAVKLINAQEDERRRISLELHDDIGQRLSLLSVALDEWEVELPSRLSFEHAQLPACGAAPRNWSRRSTICPTSCIPPLFSIWDWSEDFAESAAAFRSSITLR